MFDVERSFASGGAAFELRFPENARVVHESVLTVRAGLTRNDFARRSVLIFRVQREHIAFLRWDGRHANSTSVSEENGQFNNAQQLIQAASYPATARKSAS